MTEAAQTLKDQYYAMSLQRQTRPAGEARAFCEKLMSIVSDMHYRVTGEYLNQIQHGYKGGEA